MADHLSKSLRELRNSTEELNALTDRANDLVRRTERFLSEECRVGGPTSTHVEWMDQSAEGPNGEQGPEWSTYLCYKRHKGEHRIMVEHLLDYDLRESKPWAECSRDVKLETIKALPNLIDELLSKVNDQVSGLQATISQLDSIISPADASEKPSPRRRGD
jgi:hypothetical protein